MQDFAAPVPARSYSTRPGLPAPTVDLSPSERRLLRHVNSAPDDVRLEGWAWACQWHDSMQKTRASGDPEQQQALIQASTPEWQATWALFASSTDGSSHPRPPRLPDPTPLLTEALLTEKDREKDAVLMTEGASSP